MPIWSRTDIGPAVTSGLNCGNINPVGIIGTPVVDLASRSLFFDALIQGNPIKHFVYSLNVDTGATNPNWPADLNNAGIGFISLDAGRPRSTGSGKRHCLRAFFRILGRLRGLPWLGGRCAYRQSFNCWRVGHGGEQRRGIWGHCGVASDGTNMFVITGNTVTSPHGTWGGGEAIIRLQAGPVFSDNPTDYWAPTDWLSLDDQDADLGGCSAILIDVPGATPSDLVLALGKNGNAYLVNRDNLGRRRGSGSSAHNVDGVIRGQSSATYTTASGNIFCFSS